MEEITGAVSDRCAADVIVVESALAVGAGDRDYLIAQSDLVEVLSFGGDTDVSVETSAGGPVEEIAGTPVLRLADEIVPIVTLVDLLEPGRGPSSAGTRLVVVEADGRRLGLRVARIGGLEDVAVQPVNTRLVGGGHFSGCAVRDDGSLSLMLDVGVLLGRVALDPAPTSRRATAPANGVAKGSTNGSPVRIVAVDGRPVGAGDSGVATYATFDVGGCRYGIDAADVCEIVPGREISPVPMSAPGVAGLVNAQGRATVAIDLRILLGVDPDTNAGGSTEIVLDGIHGPVALIVDRIDDVLDAERSRLAQRPATLPTPIRDLVAAVQRFDSGLLPVIDLGMVTGAVAR
ncbi:MAG: chemotaxis protein CheW [Microthrixaceae bacterium]